MKLIKKKMTNVEVTINDLSSSSGNNQMSMRWSISSIKDSTQVTYRDNEEANMNNYLGRIAHNLLKPVDNQNLKDKSETNTHDQPSHTNIIIGNPGKFGNISENNPGKSKLYKL